MVAEGQGHSSSSSPNIFSALEKMGTLSHPILQMGKLRLREGAQNCLHGLAPETVLQVCFLGVGVRSQPGERTWALW